MKIIIIGCGRVGYTIARNLSTEKNANITMVDNKPDVFDKLIESIDVMCVRGNCLNVNTLVEAGVKDADLLISVTEADEVNILCCISAKHLGVGHTIARVRDPDYSMDLNKLWKNLGLDMIINPEFETAREVSRLLRFPTVDDIDTFVNGRIEMVSFQIPDADHYFVGKSVAEIFGKKKTNILLTMVERSNSALIAHGRLIFEKLDIIRVLGRPSDIMTFFAFIGMKTVRIQNVMIIGGSRITYYLVELLHRHSSNMDIKIIEIDRNRCEELSERFPRCQIVNGDGTDEDILMSENILETEAVVCLTDKDEENTITSLYSMQLGIRKVILKINYINPVMVRNLGLGSVVSPKNSTSDQIISYVRRFSNRRGSDIRTLYRIFDNDDDNRIEAVEFEAEADAKCLDTPLRSLKLREGILIGCIVRNSNIIIPTGESFIKGGDTVIIIAQNENLQKLDDILPDEWSYD